MSNVFDLVDPTSTAAPILVSVPHCGTDFPDDISQNFRMEAQEDLDDTDWFVDRLYDFVIELGLPMIKARYHRWVIDLNRDPQSIPLYSDGRVITDLVPLTTFANEPLYKRGKEPDHRERLQRVELYYTPYHDALKERLSMLKAQFGTALLFDAHSIRSFVPSINAEPFPDLILGDDNGRTADLDLSQIIIDHLDNPPYSFQYNQPFQGGFITRSFGDPRNSIHALQLEMSKKLYMDDSEKNWDDVRAKNIQPLLQTLFSLFISKLGAK